MTVEQRVSALSSHRLCSRHRSFVKRALTLKLTTSDPEAADLDNDKVVSAAEFIVYKLKEMGKISEEDISVVMEEFKNVDVDHSGTLAMRSSNCTEYLKLFW